MNTICIMGRMTRDPELKTAQNGTKYLNFSIAVDHGGKDGGCDFFDCVAFKATAEFIDRYFVKGKPILIQGALRTRKWTDKFEQKRTNVEVWVNSVDFCGGDKTVKKAEADDIPADLNPGDMVDLNVPVDDELPFDL